MSFKRDGDDKSQLNVLKKRRVAELLANFIPEDEAALLKNGRYTCLVCSSRPVCDTVDTLTAHRKGKRHLQGLKAFYSKKARLRDEITKRRHENYVQAEENTQEPSCSSPLLERTRRLTHHALLKTAPYNSCHRKTSTKSDRGPPSIGSYHRGDKSSSRAAAEPENPLRKTEVSSILSQGSSAGCAAAEEVAGAAAAGTQEAAEVPAQRRTELEHYLKLKSDGWLQDRNGRWVKDENVEFDSDEEEPPSLASLSASQDKSA